jgi:hypothetical protein
MSRQSEVADSNGDRMYHEVSIPCTCQHVSTCCVLRGRELT